MSILSNSFYDNITPGIDFENSGVKKIMSCIGKSKAFTCENLEQIKNDFYFKERKHDILTKMLKTKASIQLLQRHHYKEVKQKQFHNAPYNTVFSSEEVSYIHKRKEPFLETILLGNIEYSFFLQDNYIVFYNVSSQKTKYFLNVDNYIIHDVKISDDYFMYLLISFRQKQYLIKTHLSQDFVNMNKERELFNLKECVFSIPLANYEKYTNIEYIEFNEIFLRKENIITKISLGKKYFFSDYKYVYFNHQGDLEKYRKDFLEEVQDNYSNIYNKLNFLGLNDFKIKNRKLSSLEMNSFLKIFKHKFDNTLNGGINYFILRNHFQPFNDKDKIVFKESPDYHVDLQDEYVSIVGNFVKDDFESGIFSIVIEKDKVKLHKINKDLSVTFLEEMKIVTNAFYFYNLFIQIKKRELPKFPLIYPISSLDSYSFRQKNISLKIDKVQNQTSIISDLLEQYPKTQYEAFFKNNTICFENTYMWEKQSFLIGNNVVELKANTPFSLKNIKRFITNVPYIIKDDVLFPRMNGKILYTNTDSYRFPLVNKLGYIENLWKENQGKTVYFKCTDRVELVSKEQAQYKCYIPEIEDYICRNSNPFSNIQVESNDELETAVPFSKDLLITDKYSQKPLFYKIFIENAKEEDVTIYDSDDKTINDFVTRPYKNGVIFFFNIEGNKKYYYNTKNEKYIYFQPIKSFENIELTYLFEATGFVELENIHINSISLMCKKENVKNFTGTLFFYNYKDSTVKRIEITSSMLNNTFDIDINVDRIYLEMDTELFSYKDFYILESSNTSILLNENLTFFKETRDDICYIASEIQPIDIKQLLSKNIKINTLYSVENNIVIEDMNGFLSINGITDDGILILPVNESVDTIRKAVFSNISISDTKDQFYIDNFKTPGTYYFNTKLLDASIVSSNSSFDIFKDGENI
ncbi:DUF4097 domain-containing protein [Fusobacterium necrophorum subsp. funduliforme]